MTHGSLFSGIGGIDLGFEMAGIKTSWTCEIDDWCHTLLKERFPDAKHYRDIMEINKKSLQRVDIISGGFPCQDISTAGKGAGLDGKRSGLWFEMYRIIRELRPKWILIENVANLTNKGGVRVLQDLAEAGYDAEWQVISARDVGARHLRKRLWIIGYRQDVQHALKQRLERQLHIHKFPVEIKEKSKAVQEWTSKRTIHRGDTNISNSLCGELEGHSRNSKGKNRNSTRTKHDSKSSLQGRNTKLSNSSGDKHTKPSSKSSRADKERKFYNKEKGKAAHDLWSETAGCNNVSSQTTAKGREDEGSERQDRIYGKFRLKTFKRLKNESRLDRVAYGISQKVDRYYDRVKGLGNGVVPQIPFLIGQRIKYLNNILEEK